MWAKSSHGRRAPTGALGAMALAAALAMPSLAGGQERVASPFVMGPPGELPSRAVVVAAPGDTTRRRPAAIEYSDWYGRRLRIHQLASWTMLPIFVAQYAAGQQLLDKGRDGAPKWARDWHPALAGATGVLFGVNTLTGGWNWWDSRRDPTARRWRTAHAVLMLAADAGFAITPAFAEDEGGSDRSRLQTHKSLALTSMGIAAAGWLMMLPPFRRE